MRVVFVNRFYWPENPATGQLLSDLAEGLAREGHDVTVITSRGATANPPRETHRGVRIIRLRSTRKATRGLAGKAVDFATFYLGAAWRMLRETRRETLLVALTDPPLIGVAAWIVARLRRARLVHWAQDIYPELAIKLAGQRWLGALRPLRNLAWRGATRCVALGEDMAATLTRARVAPDRIVVIPNWAPARLAPAAEADVATLRAEWGLTGKFVVAYSGNLGRVHDLAPLLEVAEALRDDPEIVFVFIGDGAQRAALEADAKRRSLTQVNFFPAQPRERLDVTLGAGDVHFVTLLPGCERLVFPSKLYGITAVGRPVFFVGPRPCELARIVVEKGFGAAAERSDITSIAVALRRWAQEPALRLALGRHALTFAAENDAAHGIARWRAMLDATPA